MKTDKTLLLSKVTGAEEVQESHDFEFNFFVSIYFLTLDYGQNNNDTLTFSFLGSVGYLMELSALQLLQHTIKVRYIWQ